MYCGIVAPISVSRSNVPSPRLASAHEASTIVCASATLRRSGLRSDGVTAIDNGMKRVLTSRAAAAAAAAVPPDPSTPATASCAPPANVISEKTIGATTPQSSERASRPNEPPMKNAATASGIPRRMPSRYGSSRPPSELPVRRADVPAGALLARDHDPDQQAERREQQPGREARLLAVALAPRELRGADRRREPDEQQVEGLGPDGGENEGHVPRYAAWTSGFERSLSESSLRTTCPVSRT